jgi:dTDP-4-amino-4,6-dideoxygalactose transaminase
MNSPHRPQLLFRNPLASEGKDAGSKSDLPVPLLDVNRGNSLIRDEVIAAITQVVDSGRFLHGPEVGELECTMAGVSQTKHAISCASGSDALLLALMALEIGPGDEVILPSFTFFATASCVSRVGAKIVFVDIDPESYNVSPQAVRDAITSRTKAIIPVHLFGQCAAMDEICAIAESHKIPIIEDAAQAIGAAYQGRHAGAWGDVGCFSFYPTKNLGGMGDGGMLTCQDDAMAAKLRLYASHGMQPRYHHRVIGINSRLDTIQAAILSVKMNHLNEYTHTRQANAARYDSWFSEAGLQEQFALPKTSPGAFHVWNQYGIRIPEGRRDALKAHLQERKIGAEIYYPIPLHMQDCYRSLGYAQGCLPETERASREILHLPIYPELTIDEQRTVVEAIDSFYATAAYRRVA